MHIQRIRNRSRTRIVRIAAILLSVLTFVLYAGLPGISFAGKEGVFVNDSVYFTLEDVALSKGSDTQMMRFNVRLNNDGDSVVDFNRYGVRVTSATGGSYYAELSRSSDALVAPHSAADYYYVATLPGWLDSTQLQVSVYERSGYDLRDLGSLSVANAQSVREQAHQLVLNMADVDSALSTNAFVSFQAIKAVVVPEDGKWNVSLDVAVNVPGTESVTLPTGLKYFLHDGRGGTFAMTANAIDGSTINSGQTKHVLLTANIDTLPSTDALTLELSSGASGVASLGKLSLAPLFQLAQTGEKVSYVLQGREGISLEVQKIEERQLANQKKEALITAVLHNDSGGTLQAPTLEGVLVSQANTISVSAETALTPETYIAAGESGIYRFVAQIPDGTSADTLQFVIFEQHNATSSSTSGTSSASSASNTSSASSTSSTSSTSTSSTSSTSGTSSSSSSSSTSSSSQSSSAASSTNAIPVMAVSLQGGLVASADMSKLPVYELGQAMVFDSGSHLIDPDLEVSVVELNAHTNEDNGYQTVIAKFKLLNKSSETLDLPEFETSLTDSAGTTYPGSRQTTTSLQQLIPNSAYVYSYSYLLPPGATGTFKLSILDASNSANIQVPIADYQVTVKQTGDENPYELQKVLSVYPYDVKIGYWTMSYTYNNDAYTYKLRMDLDIQKADEVIVDESFSTLEFELVDSANRVLTSSTQQFLGTNKLISGTQTITFDSVDSDQFVSPLTVRVYESIETASGTAKRLVATLK